MINPRQLSYIPASALPSPFAPVLDRFGRFLTLGRSAFAVGGVDEAELVTGTPVAGAGEHGSLNSEPFTKPAYIKTPTTGWQ